MNWTLYGVPAWGSTLVEGALAEAGIAYDFIDVEGFDKPGPARDRLIEVNSLAQVPALVLPDGTVMTESAAIALHIAESRPDAGLAPPPGDPARPVFLRWLIWLVSNVYPTFTYGDYPERFVPEDPDGLRKAVEARREALWRIADAEAGAPFFLGSRFSLIDLYIAVMVNWRPGPDWFAAETPRLAAIARNAAARPVLGAVLSRNFGRAE